MKKLTIFFSWQTNLPENRNIIRKNIEKAISIIETEEHFSDFKIERDEATRNQPGSPSIVETLHKKNKPMCSFYSRHISGHIS